VEQQSIQWRRDKVQELSSQGNSQRDIAKILRVGIGTINRDIQYLKQQAKHNIRRYIDERLPEEYEKCLVGLTAILREAWTTSQQTEDRREKIQALSLAKECYSMKLDLLTNATVVDDAIRFVSEKSKDKDKEEQVKSSSSSPSSDSSNEDDNKESASAFGIVITQWVDNQIQIMHAEEYQRPDFNQMLSVVWDLFRRFGKINKIYIDGSNPSFIRALKIQIGEDEEYEEIIREAKSRKRNYEFSMDVVPVSFSTEHKAMLGNCKMLLERDGGYIAINPKFDKLITSLRTAEENDGVLDKEATSYDDVFDGFSLAMHFYRLSEYQRGV
jgi:hypothetical protein